MFSKPRYIVIDNEKDQLVPLVTALQSMGVGCVGYLYDPAAELPDGCLDGVRILFIDLHLTTETGTPNSANALLTALLEDYIKPSNGPYLLVLWTKHPDETEAFREYVEANIDPKFCPLEILGLAKNTFLVPDSAEDKPDLRLEIERIVKMNPQLNALINWEHAVLAAAGNTLAEINSLIPSEVRSIDERCQQFDAVLSVLAREAAGHDAVNDIRAAINGALAPLISDRVTNLTAGESTKEIWNSAVTKVSDHSVQLSSSDRSKLNSLVHIAMPSTETIAPHDWGAMICPPNDFFEDDNLEAQFEYNKDTLLSNIFGIKDNKIKRKTLENGRFCFLRIGAVCDARQKRKGPVPLALTLIVPNKGFVNSKTLPAGQYEIEGLQLLGKAEPQKAIISRLEIHLIRDHLKDWEVLFRLRDQIMLEVNSYRANHLARPGKLSF